MHAHVPNKAHSTGSEETSVIHPEVLLQTGVLPWHGVCASNLILCTSTFVLSSNCGPWAPIFVHCLTHGNPV